MSRRFLVVYCGLLMTVSAFSIDIVLPAFDLMIEDFGSPVERVQLTIPIYMLGLGLSQIFFGPASDRFGRRPMILAGLSIYFCGALICTVAPNVETVLAGRLVQGLGGGAGQVIARAIVRDRFSGSELVQNMAVVTAIFAIGPVVAPLLGYALLSFHAWQTAFVAMLVFGAGLGALAWRSSETLARPSPEALQPRELKRRAARVLGHPQSRWFLLLSAVAMMSIMAYLTQAPLLFVDALGASKLAFVVYFALSGAGIVVGQIANRRLIARLGAVSASITGAVVLAASATSVLVLDVLGLLTPLTLCACMTAFNTSYLVVYANAVSLVLDPHGAIAGFTASFVGFAGPVVAASVVVPLTFWIDGRVVPWGLFMLAVSLGCLAMLLVWRGRAGRLIEAQPQE